MRGNRESKLEVMGSELKIGICRHCDIGVDEEEYAALYRK